jgi:hypothetical protein
MGGGGRGGETADEGTLMASVAIDGAMLGRVLARLDFLNGLLSDGVEVMLNVTRCPAGTLNQGSWDAAVKLASEITGHDLQSVIANPRSCAKGNGAAGIEVARVAPVAGSDPGAAEPANLPKLLFAIITAAGECYNWKPGFFDEVHCADHLDSEGNLHPENICATLARMFRKGMVHSQSDPAGFAVAHLLQCFKQPLLRVDDDDDTFSIWLNRDIFQEYLEDLEGVAEVPDTVLLQQYDAIGVALVDRGFALRHHGNNLSNLAITVKGLDGGEGVATFCNVAADNGSAGPGTGDVVGRGSGSDANGSVSVGGSRPVAVVVGGVAKAAISVATTVEIRFPYAASLLDLINSYFSRNIPSELWMRPGAGRWLDGGQDTALRTDFADAVSTHAATVIAGWQLQPETAAGAAPQPPLTDDDSARKGASTDSGGGGSGGSAGLGSAALSFASDPLRWLWALEDWVVGTRLLRGPDAKLRLQLQSPCVASSGASACSAAVIASLFEAAGLVKCSGSLGHVPLHHVYLDLT